MKKRINKLTVLSKKVRKISRRDTVVYQMKPCMGKRCKPDSTGIAGDKRKKPREAT